MIPVSRGLIESLRGWVVRYFMAVQLSAAAVTPDVVSPDQVHDPAPIIRPYSYRRGATWDERELVHAHDEVGVLTVPVEGMRPEHFREIGNN